jgi:hypothetical protein
LFCAGVNFWRESRVRCDGPQRGQNHVAFHIFLLCPLQEYPNGVSRPSFIYTLTKRSVSDPSHDLLERFRTQPDNLHFLPDPHLAPLHLPGCDHPLSGGRESGQHTGLDTSMLNRHQEGLVQVFKLAWKDWETAPAHQAGQNQQDHE